MKHVKFTAIRSFIKALSVQIVIQLYAGNEVLVNSEPQPAQTKKGAY